MPKTLTMIEDSKVFNIWFCPECKETETITPDWYQDNGTPVCGHCDIDMKYSHTEIEG